MNESSNPSPLPPMRNRPDGAVRSTVRVRFALSGRTMDCDCGGMALRQGEQVLVDDRRDSALAAVIVATGMRQVTGTLGRVIRKAEPRDVARVEQDRRRQQEALTFARERARALGLPIKLFRTDLGGSSDRAIFFFSCEERVDFRNLVRDLAAHLRLRVEMRQVGVRDESKITGGIGSCGRELCCATYLTHFAPISIKMAKHQRLVLNPTKIAGQCSRLKCCLVYEDDLYVEMSKGLPKAGKRVETPEGIGRVDDLDVLGGRVRVSFFEKPPMTFAASEVRLVANDPNLRGPAAPRPQAAAVPDAVASDKDGDHDEGT